MTTVQQHRSSVLLWAATLLVGLGLAAGGFVTAPVELIEVSLGLVLVGAGAMIAQNGRRLTGMRASR